MEALRARLLGPVDLRFGERALGPLDSARAESLLAYLLLHRGAPQPRQRLAFMLWPDSTEPQAQTNLRKVVHTLRRAAPELEDRIDFGPRTLQWRADASVWVDVEAFEQAVAGQRLEDAVALYTGELLEGRYDEWLLDERERLAGLYLEALDRLARRYEVDRRWPQAIGCAERLVASDPLREDSHRLLMRLCHASGDGARAVRAFHVCATTLERDLGIEPSADTRALYATLVSRTPEDDAASAAAASPFVGRRAERSRLDAVWHAAAAGRSQVVLITGEAGVGKTRLVEELRGEAGAVSVEARAYAAEGPVAYGLATAWLRAPAVAERLPRLDRANRTELARLVPELTGDAPPAEPLPEPELRRRLYGAIARALLTAGAPLLLIADDVQWADAASLRVMHYLIRAAPSARLLIAATARREELDARHPLAALTAALQVLARFSEIALDRLDRDETALLAQRIAASPLDADQLDRLWRDSEGNPLFVVEALQPDAPAAGKVQAVIAGRLARLSPTAVELAEAAAAIGRSFTSEALAMATDLDERSFVAALDELWRHGIVRAHGPTAYDFSHGRIRDAAYAMLSPPRRRQAHLGVARALERTRDATPPAALAMHYEYAGATVEAIRWHERSAQAAQGLHAHADAVAALERALTLCDGLPSRRETAALQLRLLTALPAAMGPLEGYWSGRLGIVHARALELAAELGVEPEPPLTWSLALAALTRGDWEPAREFAERLHARAQRDGDQVLWVESEYIRGIAAYWPGRIEEARGHFEAALKRFQPARRRAHVLRYGQDAELVVRTRLAHVLWLLGEDEEADRQRDLALAVPEDSAHPYSRAVALVWSAWLAVDRADFASVRRHADALLAHPTADAPAQIRLPLEVLIGHLGVVEGDAAVGLARVRAAREDLVHEDAPAPGVPGVVTRVLLEDLARVGDPHAGLQLADEALGMGRGAELWEAEFRRLRATFLAATGAPTCDVDEEFERALGVAQRQGARAFERRIRETLEERRLSHHRAH